MSVTPAVKAPIISPSRLGRYLERKLNDDKHLRYVGVQGEVSNLRPQANGTLYFSLKDRDAVLQCVAFAERAATFPAIENGADVVAYGEVKVWSKASGYQLVAARLELTGIGVLHARFEELRLRLDREGLFADGRKRALPRTPFRVALVGSPSGDGTNDFLTQARQRAPHVAIRVFATAVNGLQAAPEIARAIATADSDGADLLVVVRGGGSYEDLFGFNDERVVRAIVRCKTPTVAAIGHERDVTLCELAADRAASTPSKAAQTVLPQREELLRGVRRLATESERAFALRIERKHRQLERIEQRSPLADVSRLLAKRRQLLDGLNIALEKRSPQARLSQRRGRVERLAATLAGIERRLIVARRERFARIAPRLAATAERVVEKRRAAFATLAGKLVSNDPDALLERGYAIVRAGGRIVRDPAEAPPGTAVEAQVARGTLRARVEREFANGGEQGTLF